ncbi:MAG: ATP-binding protein [Rhodospirillaceae bacterium]
MTEAAKSRTEGGSALTALLRSGLGAIVIAWKARFFSGKPVPGSPDPERGLSTEIERQAEILRAALAASPDPHFLFDHEFRVTYANPAAARIAPDALTGPFQPRLKTAFTSGEPITGEIDFDNRRYDYRLVPLPRMAGETVAVLALLRDITDHAATEQKLRQALDETEKARALAEQANQAKSRFLAAASHDLRQPLQATRLFLEVLGHRMSNNEGRDVLDRAKEALAGCDDLLKTLLDLSTLQADTVKLDIRKVPLDILFSRLLDECSPMADNKGLQLRVVPSGQVVRSDPIMLQRMLRNLLNNAIRYTSRGSVLLGCRRQGRNLLICIVDTGCGIAENLQELIFEEFYQVANRARNRTEGLGLGLSIVRRQALLLKHGLLVRSHVGRGSCFAVSVPLADDDAALKDTAIKDTAR